MALFVSAQFLSTALVSIPGSSYLLCLLMWNSEGYPPGDCSETTYSGSTVRKRCMYLLLCAKQSMTPVLFLFLESNSFKSGSFLDAHVKIVWLRRTVVQSTELRLKMTLPITGTHLYDTRGFRAVRLFFVGCAKSLCRCPSNDAWSSKTIRAESGALLKITSSESRPPSTAGLRAVPHESLKVKSEFVSAKTQEIPSGSSIYKTLHT